jgi:hypothetical protein
LKQRTSTKIITSLRQEESKESIIRVRTTRKKKNNNKKPVFEQYLILVQKLHLVETLNQDQLYKNRKKESKAESAKSAKNTKS